jgi:hypothetical protein
LRILKTYTQSTVSYATFSFLIIALAIFTASLSTATAQEQRLEVTGNIESKNGSIYYSVGDMAANKATEVVTTTPWTIGKTRFRGVLLRDLLKAVKADGQLLKASAIDGYTIEIPFSDAEKYDVIIAYRMNGKPLEDGVYAPFWVIYPYDSNTTLANDIYYSRSIWQLTKLTVE